VTGLSGFEDHLHGFAVAQFAHRDHLGACLNAARNASAKFGITVQFPLVMVDRL
jgi:hypothetical protein